MLLTLLQYWVLVVKASETACPNSPRCSAVVSPLLVSSAHSFPLEPAHQPNSKLDSNFVHLRIY